MLLAPMRARHEKAKGGGGPSGAGPGTGTAQAHPSSPPLPPPPPAPSSPTLLLDDGPADPPFAVTPWLTFSDSATEASYRADTAAARAAAAIKADRAAYAFMVALVALGGSAALRRRGLVAGVGAGTAALGVWALLAPASYSSVRPAVAVAYRLALPLAAIPGIGGGRSHPSFTAPGSAGAALAAAAAGEPLGLGRWLRWASTRPVATSTAVLGVLARLPMPALAWTLAAQVLLFSLGAPLYCPGVMVSDPIAGPFYERAAEAAAAGVRGAGTFLTGGGPAPAGGFPLKHCPAHSCELVASLLHYLAAAVAFVLAYSVEASERAAWVAGKRRAEEERRRGGSGSSSSARPTPTPSRRLPRAMPGIAVVAGAAACVGLAWLILEEVDSWLECPAESVWAGAVAAAAAAAAKTGGGHNTSPG